MHRFVFFNGKFQTSAEINLSAVSSAAFYGRGVFTTVAIYQQKPFLWRKHWRRLINHAEKLKINLSGVAEQAVSSAFFKLIEHNRIKNGRARVTFFDETAGGAWQSETNRKTSLLIVSDDFRKIKNDLHLTVSSFRINTKSPLVGVKSCNYLENILAFEEFSGKFDEALRINERNEVVSACLANVFWIKGGEIFTPALETGCLEGTTRDFLIETASENGFKVTETREKLKNLQDVDEIFLTSSGIGVKSVKKLDEKAFANHVTAKLQQIFATKTGGE